MLDWIDLPISDAQRKRLDAALSHPSHAYIVSGPVPSARDALARHLAAAYVCSGQGKRPCGVCSHCRKAASDIHPDIIRVSLLEDKRSILVDQVRQLRSDAYIRPNEAERKVFIIEHAQTMKDEAQNALLKVLEDGPAYAAFLLLAEHPQQLLSTIRSRCECISLTTASEEQAQPLDEQLHQMAGQLAQLLLGEDELALVECTVALEKKKWEKDTLSAFLDVVEDALRPALLTRPGCALACMDRLRQIRLALPFHVGVGHLLGWLATGS